MNCPLCALTFDDVPTLEAHADAHFSDAGVNDAHAGDAGRAIGITQTTSIAKTTREPHQPPVANNSQTADFDSGDFVSVAGVTFARCQEDHCNELVPLTDWENHLSWHTAQSLHAQEVEARAVSEQTSFRSLKRRFEGIAVDDERRSSPSSPADTKTGYAQQYRTSLRKDLDAGKIDLAQFERECQRLESTLRTAENTLRLAGSTSTEPPPLADQDGDISDDPDHGTSVPAYDPTFPDRAPGLVPLVIRLLTSPGMAKQGVSARLCDPGVVQHSWDPGDRHWGCGYRNIQTLMSSLLHITEYSAHLRAELRRRTGSEEVPGVPAIQGLIERAWTEGWDIAGASQLGNQLIGTRKWIGSMECAALLGSLGIRVEIIDFHTATGPDRTHPRLFDYVEEYFYERIEQQQNCASSVAGSQNGRSDPKPSAFATLMKGSRRGEVKAIIGKPPLYFQHQGACSLRVSSRNPPLITAL
ncbi:DUF1671-domain-containing protein [Gonapodya prolifera JEL478]|uniref:DUF1671-domain-containing protein n=1 Tax=Gonapodya prolifera (strain JEL478) TaxID=1344416 RepID=A0A139AZL8_GONPJ|nr:DUF1671-domain-containing protein [Gonapodya prolifera JEL478]|eukprot:KXS22188.1 DUF1671-domain-containing protein [Gonapodya prolifera JEL478]